jgi:uncharacterized protein
MEIGKYNQLTANRKTEHGVYLIDETGQEVLLPNAYVTDSLQIEDELEVFVYNDSEDRLVATTLHPKIIVDQFALLKVQHNSSFGTFMDWGLPKDLLVPFSEQPYQLAEGKSYVIFLYIDEKSNRLVGSACVDHFLDNTDVSFNPGDEVDLMVYEITDLGFKSIINSKYQGLLFKNEVFVPLVIGYQSRGYIKKIREDNKLDISLHRFGYRNIAPNADKILVYLKNNNGYLELTDNSKPETIVSLLGMSKKTFKKAIGDLYKKHLIRLDSTGIYLL